MFLSSKSKCAKFKRKRKYLVLNVFHSINNQFKHCKTENACRQEVFIIKPVRLFVNTSGEYPPSPMKVLLNLEQSKTRHYEIFFISADSRGLPLPNLRWHQETIVYLLKWRKGKTDYWHFKPRPFSIVFVLLYIFI